MSGNKEQYIYRIQLNRPEILTVGPTDAEAGVLAEHAAYLEMCVARSDVLLAGRTQTDDPAGFGIVIVSAESEAAARQIMNRDPAVKHAVMRAEFFPYKIAFVSEAILA